MNILIVEHARVQQIILKALFSDSGVEPDFVANIADAKQACQDKQYDYIFVAYSLPDGSGIEVAKYVREFYKSYPSVVLLTAEEKLSILNEAIAAGIGKIIVRSNNHELQAFIQDIFEAKIDYDNVSGHILVIDDDRTITMVTSAVLRASGSKCTICQNAEEALLTLAEHNFDLIIVDYCLSGELNGFDIVMHVRQMGGNKARTPIMVISGQTDLDRRIEILKLGANDYVAKPIVKEELVVRANNLIMQKQLFDRVNEQRDRLQQMAMTDQLTGLYNRHFLVEFAPKRIAEAVRHGNDLSLIVTDIDYFKSINDTHGHEMGDQVLRDFADILKESCRKEDMAIRLGGEEFLLLLPYCSKDGVQVKAEQLRSKVAQAKFSGLNITSSFGATCLAGGEGKNFTELFNLADDAVYQAKNTGRNKVVYKD
jgi:two-component system cell cycle response regulator